LASHFRDLLVSKTPETIELLEVGDQTKKTYLEQAKKVSEKFLLQGIELANDCDLKYKTSKNQRLLVELCLMQLASINYDGEKKNSKHYIIPSSYFKEKGISPIPVKIPENKRPQQELRSKTTDDSEVETPSKEHLEALKVKEPPKIVLDKTDKKPSGLSISSIRKKKEHQIKQMEVVVDETTLPTEAFTEEALIKAWKTYADQIQDKGQFNLASILTLDKPKLKGNTIHLEFPNKTNKVELEREQYNLLGFLRKKLNNFDINLSITVNETKEKTFVYTTHEKFEKLKEKNPNIDILRKTFDLDL